MCAGRSIGDEAFNIREEREETTVAHINEGFFYGSETFIYNYVSNHKQFKPICIASKFMNQDQFPFPVEDMLQISPSRKGDCLGWVFSRAMRRFCGIDPWLSRRMKSRSCAVMHAHYGPIGCYMLPVKKELGIPLVTNFYGYDISRKAVLEQYADDYGKLFQKGDLFLVLGPNMRERLIEAGCPPNKVKIQRIAISVNRVSFRQRKPKSRGEKVRILFAGRLVEKKGLHYVLQALKQVLTINDRFQLNIVGDGPMRQSIEDEIRQTGLNGYVHLLGYKTYSRYLQEMDAADLFILPSITAESGDSEGTPTVILEAQAHGLPVISTYHADIPSIVVPEKSALLSEERDMDTLARNILFLLDNQDAWEAIGGEGRKYVEKYHNIEIEIDVLEERYNELLGVRPV